jgi:hypothetical protein
MASLYSRTGYYGITFRYDGEKYNRSLSATSIRSSGIRPRKCENGTLTCL